MQRKCLLENLLLDQELKIKLSMIDWFLSLNSLRSLGIVGFTTAVMGIRKDGINIKFLQKIIEGTNF